MQGKKGNERVEFTDLRTFEDVAQREGWVVSRYPRYGGGTVLIGMDPDTFQDVGRIVVTEA